MTSATVVATRASCTACGQRAELSDNGLCLSCWDQECDQAHRQESAASHRAYYQAHRQEIAVSHRAYYQAHRKQEEPSP